MKNYIQKIGAALVLLLFLLSIVPVALADTGLGVSLEAEVKVSGDSAEASTDSEVKSSSSHGSGKEEKYENRLRSLNPQGEIRNRVDVSKDILERNLERKEDLKDLAEKRLAETKNRLKETREDYIKVKEKHRLAVEKHRKQREKVRDLNDQAKKCRNGDSEECEELRLELKLGVILHLEKTINVVDRALEKLKNRVGEIKDLSDEEKENALDLIASIEAELDAVKEKVDNFDEKTTKEEVRSAISELKDIAKKVRVLQKRIVSLLINAKLGVLVEKHAEFRNGMELRIKTLVELGVDVSELEDILAEFDQKVEELEQDYETAQQKWKDSNNDRFDLFVREVREAQHQVRKDLQETKKILREFIRKYRELKNHEETDGSEDKKRESSEKSGVEASGNVELSAETQATLDSLVTSLASVEGKVELTLKVKKEDDETAVKSEVEGSLTAEQEELWATLQEQAKILVEEAEGDAELEIEIEHEKEVSEDEKEDKESGETGDDETDMPEEGVEDSEENGEDDSEETNEESQVEVSGDVELSSEAQVVLTELAASLSSDKKLQLKAEKKEGQTTVETEAKGSLTLEQQGLWAALQELVKSLLEEAEGDELSLEISIENAE